MATSFTVYLGAFEGSFREQVIKKWTKFVLEQEILISENFDYSKILGLNNQVPQWVVKGLPEDK